MTSIHPTVIGKQNQTKQNIKYAVQRCLR